MLRFRGCLRALGARKKEMSGTRPMHLMLGTPNSCSTPALLPGSQDIVSYVGEMLCSDSSGHATADWTWVGRVQCVSSSA